MAAADIREREAVVAGVRSPVIESGPAAAEEAAVFVHGNPGSARDWEDLVARVGEFGRALALDMPGFGDADRPADFEYTSFGYAGHLGGALKELGVKRAHLVLHDFGGPWGLVWATGNPDRFRSVVLIDCGLLRGYRWHPTARKWRTPVVGELMMLATNRWTWRRWMNRGAPLPRAFTDRLYAKSDRRQRRAVLALYRATNEPDKLHELTAPRFRDLDRPALVVWGRHDPYLPVEQAEANRDGFPRAEIAILEDSGHFPFADDPEGTARVVVPFLRAQLEG
jgi:pimeloyl-ACP methyl ester carboxylesterase